MSTEKDVRDRSSAGGWSIATLRLGCQYHDQLPMSGPFFTSARRDWALAVVVYSVLTLLLFHGLFGRLTAVPDLGDPLLSTCALVECASLSFVESWWDGSASFLAAEAWRFRPSRGARGDLRPIQWIGGTPVLAYNVALLSSFVLSALAAHAAGVGAYGSHAAGMVSGLIFGFNPFRISHCPSRTAGRIGSRWPLRPYTCSCGSDLRWLAVFAVCWWLQGLSSGYYLLLPAPVIGLWAIWFARSRPWRGLAAIMLACGMVFVLLLPVSWDTGTFRIACS